MDVALSSGTENDERAVANMFTAYFYELAAWDPGIVLNGAGLPVWSAFGDPGPRTLDECSTYNWWIRDSCLRYAIRTDAFACGFAIVCERPAHLEEDVDNELLDFYVAPKVRRSGVGTTATRLVLERHRGSWILYTLRGNLAAQAFWRSTLDAVATDVEESADATEFRFRT